MQAERYDPIFTCESAGCLPQLRTKDVEASVRLILDTIANHLVQGERAKLRGFGSFCINQRPARTGRNPKTGEKVEVPAKPTVYFKAGKELRERANNMVMK
jgi:integration host factor subunit beta